MGRPKTAKKIDLSVSYKAISHSSDKESDLIKFLSEIISSRNKIKKNKGAENNAPKEVTYGV